MLSSRRPGRSERTASGSLRLPALALAVLSLALVACPRKSQESPAPVAGQPASTDFPCYDAAQKASSAIQEAARVAGAPPVDANSWSGVESTASSALSAAESACSGSSDSVNESRAAISAMRSMLSDLSNAARGNGGASNLGAQIGEVDERLNKAKSLIR